jgi:hypothetical protein
MLFISLSGCTDSGKKLNETSNQVVEENRINKDKAIMDEFNALLQKDNSELGEALQFISQKMSAVTPQSASTMLISLENKQKNVLSKMQGTYEEDAIQKRLAKDFKGDLTDVYLNGIQDKDIKKILLETKNNGFKIETAEGFYFPVLDYSQYKQYRSNVTPDIAAYIDIMAVESDKTPAKDAGLMIGWEEIVKRAISQEQFLKTYNESSKAEDVKLLLKRYLVFALYGTNNTPLFQYEDKQMVPAAKKTYLSSTWDGSGSFTTVMTEYLTLVKKNNYILTQEVDEYRKKAIQEFR